MSEIDEKMLTNMSPEDQKYYKKYLKYKNKYIELEKNMNDIMEELKRRHVNNLKKIE